jgi:glycosyltransferase involved in cell wall biosynthesis
VFRVPIVPRGSASALRLSANYLSFILSAGLVGPWVLRGRPFDVVFVYAPSPIVQVLPAALLARVKGARLVTWVQDLWPESLVSTGFVRHPALLRLADWLVRRLYSMNDLLLGQSRAFVRAIAPRAGHVAVEYFPNPGEAELGNTGVPPDGPTLGPGFNVVFAGNLGTVQSLDTILDAAERLRAHPDIRIVLVGSGSRAGWAANEITRRQLTNVSMPGRYPSSAMPSLFAQASALLVSLSRSEILSQTIPAKVQTYLAAGRPVIASMDGEGAELVVASGAGVAAPAEDAEALAARVAQLHAMPVEDREAMGRSGRRYYDEHFRPEVLAGRLIDRLSTLTAGRGE